MGKKLFPYLISERWLGQDRPALGLDCPAGFVRQVGNLEDRTLEFIGSTEDTDRYQEVIGVSGWDLKAYRLNPVFLFGHDYYSPPIGRGLKVWKDLESEVKRLMFNVKFATAEEYEFADTIYRLYQGGYMNAVSVGFLPMKWEENEEYDRQDPKSPWRIYLKQELLELSAVPVPANPFALATALHKGVVRDAEFNRLVEVGVPIERERIDLSKYTQVEIVIDAEDEPVTPVTHRYFCGKCLAEMESPGCTYCADCRKVQPVDPLANPPVIVTPEFMERLGETNGATIEWQDSEPYLREQIILAGLRMLKAKVFGELPESRRDAILTSVTDGERIDPLLHDDLASALFSAVVGARVEVKAGAVLNKRNLARVKAIKASAEEILTEAEPAQEDEPAVPIINDDEPKVESVVPVTPSVPEKCPADARPACPPEVEIIEILVEKTTVAPAGDGGVTRGQAVKTAEIPLSRWIPCATSGPPQDNANAPAPLPGTGSDPNIPDAHGYIEFVESPHQAAEEPILELLPDAAAGGNPSTLAPLSPQGQGDIVLELDAKGANDLASVVAKIVRQTLAEATGDVRYVAKAAKRR